MTEQHLNEFLQHLDRYCLPVYLGSGQNEVKQHLKKHLPREALEKLAEDYRSHNSNRAAFTWCFPRFDLAMENAVWMTTDEVRDANANQGDLQLLLRNYTSAEKAAALTKLLAEDMLKLQKAKKEYGAWLENEVKLDANNHGNFKGVF